ncbi:MAG: bifunctional enzyme phytoene desaturase/synthetase [Naasia sp.]|jgi:phytoene/squalene synthetase|nr:squalene/phytoene synthase family protein [Naasia sp.]MCU1570318.1 bifunctional enzyme phytoene desaturase/synthetase [Naasia sp.]
MSGLPALELYDRVAQEAAAVVIRRYSSSFGLAARLLDSGSRVHIRSIYALVRVADEIVDGVAAAAGLPPEAVLRRLDELERDLDDAMASGYSVNLVVHAFAITARRTGFGRELTAPFFSSMRADVDRREHTDESFAEYVYGSAEVVGLMCLAAFLEGEPARDSTDLVRGARALGSAFQKINFLRDLAADFRTLGRSYFPGVRVDSFDEATKLRLLDDVDEDLRVAASLLPALPAGSRRAVAVAHGLFVELSRRVRATPAERLLTARISVPTAVKLRIAMRPAGLVPRR